VVGFLGGEASVETRKILEQGENPLTASCDLRAASCEGDVADSMVEETEMAAPRGRPRDPLARPGNLDGLKEIIGLALGAPEFQRR
jgi:hypothetical protein